MHSDKYCLLFFFAMTLCGCVSSPANPMLLCLDNNPDPKGEARIVRGVVNGLWKYDREKFGALMAKYDEQLTPEERTEYSDRYIVRVGIDRAPPIEFISPFPLGKWIEYVVLPADWSHDPRTISADPKVINVGDVVDVWAQKGRYFDFLNALVRQCDAAPVAGENKDWNIGCKTYEDFDKAGFAGDYHYLRTF
jgi:hypothetical protein